MQRRDFIKALGAGLLSIPLPDLAYALAPAGYERLLVLIELKGGNDGLNTVIPYASRDYYRLRPEIAIPREQVLQLDSDSGLHPALAPLMPLWQAGQMAIVQGVGYPDPNLSHFRSIDIWDSASNSHEYLSEGWLTRLFREHPAGNGFASDGIIIGSQTLGPMAGGARAVVLRDAASFARQARLAHDMAGSMTAGNALSHVLKVESDIQRAAQDIGHSPADMTQDMGRIPDAPGSFGRAVKTLLSTLDGGTRIAVARLTLSGFDTHNGQQATQQRLLAELAEGLAALQQGLAAQGKWDDTLLMSYAEFGRRPRENGNKGTDHGTANAHFVLGGRVKGGLYGQAPQLAGVSDGNLPFAVDFRQLHATAIDSWWGKSSRNVLGGHFAPLPLLRS